MAEYSFYTNSYMGGSIPVDEFPRLAKRAGEQLAQYKRLYTVTAPENDAEDMAVCAMADALYYFETAQNGGGPVASASIGSVSVSYSKGSTVDVSPQAQERELFAAACRYLDIYRGCG